MKLDTLFVTITKKAEAGEIMNKKQDYIAVFDSGVGGISVLKELMQLMPEENYLYFGDSANAPYGNRPTEQVRSLTLESARYLVDCGIKALVVACNTATSAAIEILRQTYQDLIVVGIEPALKLAADRFPNGRIGVMATQVTLREEKFAHQLERFPNAQVSLIPAPGLVELVEAGGANTPAAEQLLMPILAPYRGKLDALVLGCTHYPFVKETIGNILGEETMLLDGGEGTARQTKRCLEQAQLLNEGLGSLRMENSCQDARLLRLCMELLKEKEYG